jgi:TRAP transporter 4TM/12TM fusion protein
MKDQVIEIEEVTHEELEEIEFGRHRVIKNRVLKMFLHTIFALIPICGILYVLGIHQTLGLSLYAEQYIGLFLGLVLCAIFLSFPASKRLPKGRIPWYDWILAALGLYAGLYLLFFYPDIVMRLGYVSTGRLVMSIIAILLIFEAIRRVLDTAMLVIVILFVAYGYFAPYFPGVFRGSRTSAKQLFNYLYLDPSSMMNMLNLAATIGLVYILFGQILLTLGGAGILNNFALATFGRFRGGSAKGAILGSSLVGTITGNPVTNVMLVGTVTIPLMKKNGFSATQAGAIESVASSGGQIMPPVMGIAAFIIAETLGVPYAEVALAALIPALMYFLCLFFQVDLIAARENLHPLSKERIPRILKVFKTGWMIIPIFVALIYFLFFKGATPQAAGIYASAIAVVFLSMHKSLWRMFLTWKGIQHLFSRIFVDTGKLMLDITIVLAAAGLVMGVTGVTGLGFNIGLILISFVQYGLLVLLIVSAIVCAILGMGMPTVAAYAVVAVLVAPTLTQMGVDPMAAHLFVFYFAIVSCFTPPVAVSCLTAAPIAKANVHSIGWAAMRLGIVAYFVPFLFVYAPEILIRKNSDIPLLTTIMTIGTALFGCYLLAVAVEGFLFTKLSAIKRGMVIILAILLFMPNSVWEFSIYINMMAIVLAVIFIVTERKLSRSQPMPLSV